MQELIIPYGTFTLPAAEAAMGICCAKWSRHERREGERETVNYNAIAFLFSELTGVSFFIEDAS